jgi:hypothetical protein
MPEMSREIGNKEAVERAVRRLSDYGLSDFMVRPSF